jgi:chitin disaccharide deacetylase
MPALRPNTRLPVILCADDYAISAGVTRGILELARQRRLSATSAIVTLPRWKTDAPALVTVRDRIAVGLHLNLTMGRPLGPMPSLAPGGELPAIGALVKAALARRLDPREVEDEIRRQIEQFVAATGYAPDHVDGHQHVHALPIVRHALIAALRHLQPARPLLRDTVDRPQALLRRGRGVLKGLAVTALCAGFGRLARRHGLPTSDGFSGFSVFDEGQPYAAELERAMSHPGARHIVMCHPGYPDDELAARDPVTTRRRQELNALLEAPNLVARIWHPDRRSDGPSIDWTGEDGRGS